jgi:hypothetical protein
VRPYLEKNPSLKRAGGVAQGVGPEFKPQYLKKKKKWSWWHTPVINEAKRMRQEDHEFEASLGYTLKKKKKSVS